MQEVNSSEGNFSVFVSGDYNGSLQTMADQVPADWMALMGVAVGCALSVLGILGNSITIEAYRRNRKLQTSFNHLITNLCAVDLVFSVFVMPLILPLVVVGDDFYPHQLCTTLGFVYYSTISSSVVNLVFIAFNRYVGIVHSSKYRKLFSKECIKWWLIAVWISAPILYTPFIIFDAFSWRPSSLRCALSTNKLGSSPLKYYQIAVNVLLQLIPAITLIFLYRAILRKVKRCRKSVEHYPTPFSASPTGGDLNESSRAASGRRRSASRPQSPHKAHETGSASNTPEKKSMSYLQVPASTPTKAQTKNVENYRESGRGRTAMSSPDILSSGCRRDSFKMRGKKDVNRRKSWGDNSDSGSVKSGIFRMRSEHTLNSNTQVHEIPMLSTILSTIDSEPTSKTMSLDHNDYTTTPCSSTEDGKTSCNDKMMQEVTSTHESLLLPPQDARECLMSMKQHNGGGSVSLGDSPVHLAASEELSTTPRRSLRPLKRIMSIGGVKEGMIKDLDSSNTKEECCQATINQRILERRSFTIPMRRTPSTSGSKKRKGSRKRARSVGINRFSRRMTSGKKSTPKIVIDHPTSDDVRVGKDEENSQHPDEESTSSLVAEFARRSGFTKEESHENSHEDCRWCQNLMRKLLKNYRSNSIPQQHPESTQNEDNKYDESVFNEEPPESNREGQGRSDSVSSAKQTTTPDAETSSWRNQNSSLSVDVAVPSNDNLSSDDRRLSVGSRLYRYSIGGGQGDDFPSRQDSISCAGYEYTTTRNNQRNPSRTNRDLGLDGNLRKKTKVARRKSIYNTWRRKSFLNSSLHSNTSSTDSRRRHRRREAERHLAYSGLIICAAFAICVLPTSVISVLEATLKIRITATVKFAAGMLSWFHAVVNPILYGFLNPKYRLEFRRMMSDLKYCWRTRGCCCCCCWSANLDQAGSQISITSGIRGSRSWNPSSWWESNRRPSGIPQRL